MNEFARHFFAHEVDDVAEGFRVARIGCCEGLVGLEADRGAFAARTGRGLDCGAGGSRRQVSGTVLDAEEIVETQTAEEFTIASGGVDDLQGGVVGFHMTGETAEDAHEGAVHACAGGEVDDDTAAGQFRRFCEDELLQDGAVEMAAFSGHADPEVSVNTPGENS